MTKWIRCWRWARPLGSRTPVHRLVDSFGFAADYRLAGFQRHCDWCLALMAGQIIAGGNPIDRGEYQFLILAPSPR